MHAALGVIADPAQPGHPAGTALLTTKRWEDTRMIKSLTRVCLSALFSTTIFAAAAIAPPPASADWVGEIDPGAEQPAGQAEASGFADENGHFFIPTPAQEGEIAEVIFRGSGAIKVAVIAGTTWFVHEAPDQTGLQLTITTSRVSAPPHAPIPIISHDISLRRVDPTLAVMQQLFIVTTSATDGVLASVVLTGTFDCSGTICDGPQDGKLSFGLEVRASPE